MQCGDGRGVQARSDAVRLLWRNGVGAGMLRLVMCKPPFSRSSKRGSSWSFKCVKTRDQGCLAPWYVHDAHRLDEASNKETVFVEDRAASKSEGRLQSGDGSLV
jgi:hypothetical protein